MNVETQTVDAQAAGQVPERSPSVSMLIGSYERSLDSKYRSGLPPKFWDKLEGSTLILVPWLNRTLALFPSCNWYPVAESINSLGLYTAEGLTVRNQLFAQAREVSIDNDRRFVIAPDLATYARLEVGKKLMLCGDWDKVIISSPICYTEKKVEDDVRLGDRLPVVLEIAKGHKPIDELFAK